MTATATAGQAHESTPPEPVVDAVRIGRRCRPRQLVGDKGYSYGRVRRDLHRRGIRPVTPLRIDQRGRRGRPITFDSETIAVAT